MRTSSGRGIMPEIEEFYRLLDSLKWGETVLLEHDSLTSPAQGLYYIIKWAMERNYPVVVDDFLDTLYLYATHMELAGFNTSILNNVKVIKLGGKLKVGDIVTRLPVNEPEVYEKKYAEVTDSLFKQGKVINPVLGFERLLVLANSNQEILMELNGVLEYIGNEKRIAFYIINEEVIEKSNPYIEFLLREMATTLIKMSKKESRTILSILKSVNNELDGKEMTFL